MQDINHRFRAAEIKKPPAQYQYKGIRKFNLEEQKRRLNKKTKDLNLYNDHETSIIEGFLRGFGRRAVSVSMN